MNTHIRQFVAAHTDKIVGRVLEVGSRNYNGAIAIENCIKTDMEAGDNVDVVCPAENLPNHFGCDSFDTVVSLDALEHMSDWRGCINGMWDVLKPNGWLVMSMASTKKGRHNYPNDYWRATPEHIKEIFPNLHTFAKAGKKCIGWTVRKNGRLPDLSTINLLPVDSI